MGIHMQATGLTYPLLSHSHAQAHTIKQLDLNSRTAEGKYTNLIPKYRRILLSFFPKPQAIKSWWRIKRERRGSEKSQRSNDWLSHISKRRAADQWALQRARMTSNYKKTKGYKCFVFVFVSLMSACMSWKSGRCWHDDTNTLHTFSALTLLGFTTWIEQRDFEESVSNKADSTVQVCDVRKVLANEIRLFFFK